MSELTPTAQELLDLLRDGQHYVYRIDRKPRQWAVTRGLGLFDFEPVQELVRAGLVTSVYSNCPTEAYHVGRTFDVERTLSARKQFGKAAPDYYVGDP